MKEGTTRDRSLYHLFAPHLATLTWRLVMSAGLLALAILLSQVS